MESVLPLQPQHDYTNAIKATYNSTAPASPLLNNLKARIIDRLASHMHMRGRIPLTRHNAAGIVIPPILLYLYLCYLVRRPNTRKIRMALLPIAVPWLLALTFAVQWLPTRTMAWNVPITTTGVLFAVRAAEYCLSPTGRRKLTESIPGEAHLQPDASLYQKILWGVSDAVELIISQRGVGWDFGTGEGLRLPLMQSHRPVQDRLQWLIVTSLRDVLCNYLIVDIISTWWRTIPEISKRPADLRGLTLPLQIAVPGTVMIVVPCYMSMWYEVAAVLDVSIMGRAPSAWPVLFGEPWKAKSLHDLWAFEWHQLSRRTFLSTVGYPMRALFGTPGMMLGAFISSGLYHNLMLIGDGLPGLNLPTMFFFVVQAVGLIAERMFRQVTGRKVGGMWGNMWTILFLLITVQPMAEVWIDRGYLETSPIRPEFSVVERLVRWKNFAVQ
ncbi:hypothetical protein FRB95_012840 [Tulasnella sp. JGI-2019a]|nr:hypothetical protein FRB93_004658 [Tulasnella sp. JGI-2019a]KAG9039129.1 hypothetical protein FRB95_012840 [Tulasnella sp. JGI-2019a]